MNDLQPRLFSKTQEEGTCKLTCSFQSSKDELSEEKVPDDEVSPTFRNTIVEQSINNPSAQQKAVKEKIFNQLNLEIKNMIEEFFANGFKN